MLDRWREIEIREGVKERERGREKRDLVEREAHTERERE